MKDHVWLHEHWAVTVVGRFPFFRLRRVSYSNIGIPADKEPHNGVDRSRVWDCICGYHS